MDYRQAGGVDFDESAIPAHRHDELGAGLDVSGSFDAAPLKSRVFVLAVDDDSLVLANVVAMLEDLGHQAMGASSAFAALTAFESHPGIDLVISDQVMPVTTGLQLIESLRARRPELPAILATG